MNTDRIYAESIVNEYAPKEASKVIALRKLDRKAKRPAVVFAYTFGTISALLLGTGMCLSMGVLASGTQTSFIMGIVIGLLGIAGSSMNYPLYRKIRASGMKKYATDIMLLAKDISDQT